MTCQFYLYHYCQALARTSVDTSPVKVDYVAYQIQELCHTWATYFCPPVLSKQWSSSISKEQDAWEVVQDTADCLQLLFDRCAALREYFLQLNVNAYNRRLVELKGSLREVIIPEMIKRGYDRLENAQCCTWDIESYYIESFAPFITSSTSQRIPATYSDAERIVAEAYAKIVSRAPSLAGKQYLSMKAGATFEWVHVTSSVSTWSLTPVERAMLEGGVGHPTLYEDLIESFGKLSLTDRNVRVPRTEMIG